MCMLIDASCGTISVIQVCTSWMWAGGTRYKMQGLQRAHVRAFRLAVHEHIEPKPLLDAHDLTDEAVHQPVVLLVRDLARFASGACAANRDGLREASDSSGGETLAAANRSRHSEELFSMQRRHIHPAMAVHASTQSNRPAHVKSVLPCAHSNTENSQHVNRNPQNPIAMYTEATRWGLPHTAPAAAARTSEAAQTSPPPGPAHRPSHHQRRRHL